MFLMVARLRRRARATPRRSPFTSVTPALCMATSVPVPMAMPTWAWARAGASLTPSPAMATTWPASWSRRTTSAFCVRQDLRPHVLDAQPSRHGLRR